MHADVFGASPQPRWEDMNDAQKKGEIAWAAGHRAIPGLREVTTRLDEVDVVTPEERVVLGKAYEFSGLE